MCKRSFRKHEQFVPVIFCQLLNGKGSSVSFVRNCFKGDALEISESLQHGWSLPISQGLEPQIAVALSAMSVTASPGLQSHLNSSTNCSLVIFFSFCTTFVAAAFFA